MKAIFLALFILLLVLQYQLWFAPGGVTSLFRLQQSIQHQIDMNKQLAARNNQLIADINDLKNGNEAIEERARNDLGMIKKGEVFYQIVK